MFPCIHYIEFDVQGGECVSNFQKGIFDKLKQTADIDSEEVLQVAESLKHADFSDEQTVHNLVRHLSKVANKSLTREQEMQIVNSITKNNMPTDFQSLNNLFK